MEEQKTFEQSLEELEGIVKKLEDGNVPMENLVALYEQGAELGKQCLAMLDVYEAKISMLSSKASNEED